MQDLLQLLVDDSIVLVHLFQVVSVVIWHVAWILEHHDGQAPESHAREQVIDYPVNHFTTCGISVLSLVR